MKKTIEQLENDERIRELNSEKYKKDRELTEKINDIRNLESQNENLQKHMRVLQLQKDSVLRILYGEAQHSSKIEVLKDMLKPGEGYRGPHYV